MHGCHFVVLNSTKNYINKICIHFKHLYHTKFRDPTLSGASAATILQFRVSAMLLLTVGSLEVQGWSALH